MVTVVTTFSLSTCCTIFDFLPWFRLDCGALLLHHKAINAFRFWMLIKRLKSFRISAIFLHENSKSIHLTFDRLKCWCRWRCIARQQCRGKRFLFRIFRLWAPLLLCLSIERWISYRSISILRNLLKRIENNETKRANGTRIECNDNLFSIARNKNRERNRSRKKDEANPKRRQGRKKRNKNQMLKIILCFRSTIFFLSLSVSLCFTSSYRRTPCRDLSEQFFIDSESANKRGKNEQRVSSISSHPLLIVAAFVEICFANLEDIRMAKDRSSRAVIIILDRMCDKRMAGRYNWMSFFCHRCAHSHMHTRANNKKCNENCWMDLPFVCVPWSISTLFYRFNAHCHMIFTIFFCCFSNREKWSKNKRKKISLNEMGKQKTSLSRSKRRQNCVTLQWTVLFLTFFLIVRLQSVCSHCQLHSFVCIPLVGARIGRIQFAITRNRSRAENEMADMTAANDDQTAFDDNNESNRKKMQRMKWNGRERERRELKLNETKVSNQRNEKWLNDGPMNIQAHTWNTERVKNNQLVNAMRTESSKKHKRILFLTIDELRFVHFNSVCREI